MTEPSKRVDRRQWWWDGQRWRPYPGAKGRPPHVAPVGIRNVAGTLIGIALLAVAICVALAIASLVHRLRP